ncbi:MAG: hypothetical protein AB4040_10910 [Synechococcus sp.]
MVHALATLSGMYQSLNNLPNKLFSDETSDRNVTLRLTSLNPTQIPACWGVTGV